MGVQSLPPKTKNPRYGPKFKLPNVKRNGVFVVYYVQPLSLKRSRTLNTAGSTVFDCILNARSP